MPSKLSKRVLCAIFIALILLQISTPFLGNIPLGFVNLTIIHITVIIGTIVLGTKMGVLLGGVWGLASLTRAIYYGNVVERAIFSNPLIAVVPRLVVPLVVGLLYFTLRLQTKPALTSVIAAIGSLTNTILVLSFIYFFAGAQFAAARNIDSTNLLNLLISLALSNGVFEAIAAFVLVPIIISTLKRLKRIA